MNYDTTHYQNELPKHVESTRKGVETLLGTSGCYFSYHADLTMTMQNKYKHRKNFPMERGNQGRMGEMRYVWNYNLLKDFMFQKISNVWLVPVI